MRLNFTKIFIAAAIVLAATVTSCKAPQSLAYFENADSLKTVGTTALDYAVKIRPADELIITVNSIVPEATAAYNLPLVNPSLEGEVSVSSTPQNQTYVVDTDGEITMPVIGKIHAAGMTTKGLGDYLTEKISIDMQLPLRYVNESLIQELELLEPFGKGNPKPLFAEKNLKVINPRIIGKNKNVLKFKVQDKDGYEMDAICFGDVEACLETIEQSEMMAFTYYPSINEFRGERTIQMVVQNYNPSK